MTFPKTDPRLPKYTKSVLFYPGLNLIICDCVLDFVSKAAPLLPISELQAGLTRTNLLAVLAPGTKFVCSANLNGQDLNRVKRAKQTNGSG